LQLRRAVLAFETEITLGHEHNLNRCSSTDRAQQGTGAWPHRQIGAEWRIWPSTSHGTGDVSWMTPVTMGCRGRARSQKGWLARYRDGDPNIPGVRFLMLIVHGCPCAVVASAATPAGYRMRA
jgi:hypothetical protein